MTDAPTHDQLLAEGRRQARIEGVDQNCAPVYVEGWADGVIWANAQAALATKEDHNDAH